MISDECLLHLCNLLHNYKYCMGLIAFEIPASKNELNCLKPTLDCTENCSHPNPSKFVNMVRLFSKVVINETRHRLEFSTYSLRLHMSTFLSGTVHKMG